MVEIISNIGSLECISELKINYYGKSILLVTGKDSYSICGAETILNTAFKNEKITRFCDFEVSPKIQDAQRGVTLARSVDVDVIIAVGGGSVIDMAKLIKAFYSIPESAHQLARGELAVPDPDIPLIVAPTTAGSGSEATNFAVVYIGSDKHSVTSQILLPEIVFLDGNLIATGSPYQKACNGLDALAQSIESAWSVGSTKVSRGASFEAINLCLRHLKKVVENNADKIDLQEMLRAANLAGQAINISKTTAAHAWSYGITSQYGVPHGHAVWLTLPEIFQIHASSAKDKLNDKRGNSHFRAVMDDLMKILSIPGSELASVHMKKFLQSINVEDKLSKIGADTTSKRLLLSEKVNSQRMGNNPINLDKEDIDEIFCLNNTHV